MKPLIKKSRQAIKTSILVLIFAVFLLPQISAQNKEQYKNCIYATKSNILNPDTLKSDQKKIFWHFVELTHKQAEALEPLKIKAEFEKIGITVNENDRFARAYSFFDTSIIGHKRSCEQWQSFRDLESKN
jgi:hypothetical protein